MKLQVNHKIVFISCKDELKSKNCLIYTKFIIVKILLKTSMNYSSLSVYVHNYIHFRGASFHFKGANYYLLPPEGLGRR